MAGWWVGTLLLGVQIYPALLSFRAPHPSPFLSCWWVVRVGEGQAWGFPRRCLLPTYEECCPGLDAVVAAVQVAKGLCQVDAELLLAVGHLAIGQPARHCPGLGRWDGLALEGPLTSCPSLYLFRRSKQGTANLDPHA
jgi:hypothetical protein